MRIYILGIGGTFMGSLALLARDLGHQVSGCDRALYPPMSTQLQQAGISLQEGFEAAQLPTQVDLVLVGNMMARGRYPIVEALLNSGLAYTSGPQWLAEQVLPGRHCVAVAGTHGKTTTSSLLTWILHCAGYEPGFLIGGIPQDFQCSTRLGKGDVFILEADEYDTAFFDKRSKFVHYRPRTLILNNLEFDHADIFDDLAAIRRQFQHLLRTVPGTGHIIYNAADAQLQEVLTAGCWSPCTGFLGTGDWQVETLSGGGEFFHQGVSLGQLRWGLSGAHNLHNALAALVTAHHLGVDPQIALSALAHFGGVKRRQEVRGVVNGVTVLDDFAHHPTAIQHTLAGLRSTTQGQLVAILEPRSNTMRLGVLQAALQKALQLADRVVLYRPPDLPWDAAMVLQGLTDATLCESVEVCVNAACERAKPGDTLVVMSNGGFGDIHQHLLAHLGRETP